MTRWTQYHRQIAKSIVILEIYEARLSFLFGLSSVSSTRQGAVMVASYTLNLLETYFKPATLLERRYSTKNSHNTENFTPYSFRIVCGFLNVTHWTF